MHKSLPLPIRFVSLVCLLGLTSAVLGLSGCSPKKEETKTVNKPALSVVVVSPQMTDWSLKIEASGNIAPWQEASVASEIGGLKLAEVLVNVGDTVRKGQLLARMSDESVQNDLAQQKAAVAEAEANLAQARHNIDRARELEPSGSISRQDLIGYETQAATTAARLASSKALLAAQSLRLTYTRVLAPDDGVISARSATAGSVVTAGVELFKLIRKNRLEWRGELRSDDLIRVTPGQVVQFVQPDGVALVGKVRQVAPTVDTAARTGLVYVDLPAESRFKAGMFISAVLLQGQAKTLAIPQTAVVVRDGFNYAMRVGPDNLVHKTKLTLGKRQGNVVELIDGLKPEDRVVTSGGAFLNEGDRVNIVAAQPKKEGDAAGSKS